MKTGRDLEKHIRKVIKDYEKNLEEEKAGEIEESTELEDMEEAIKEVLAEEDLKEEEIEEIEEVKEDLGDVMQKIKDIFVKCKSSMEMQELFEIIDTEIRKIDGVNFKATTSDLVYQISGMNFLRIRPKSNKLTILHAPDYYKNIVNLTDENEIDNVMISIKESYEYIKKKRNKE